MCIIILLLLIIICLCVCTNNKPSISVLLSFIDFLADCFARIRLEWSNKELKLGLFKNLGPSANKVVVDNKGLWQSSHYNQHEHKITEPTQFNTIWHLKISSKWIEITWGWPWGVDRIFLGKSFVFPSHLIFTKTYNSTNDLENLFPCPTVSARSGGSGVATTFSLISGLEKGHHHLVWKIN